jgi:hypothetical protein
MMSVTLYNKSSSEISAILDDLKQQNLVVNKDFEFWYSPSRWDEMIGDVEKHTTFVFQNGKYATLFALKYSA